MNEILDIANMQKNSLGFVDIYKIKSLTKSSIEYIKNVLDENSINYRVERFG